MSEIGPKAIVIERAIDGQPWPKGFIQYII